jgi:hypothetical protein
LHLGFFISYNLGAYEVFIEPSPKSLSKLFLFYYLMAGFSDSTDDEIFPLLDELIRLSGEAHSSYEAGKL